MTYNLRAGAPFDPGNLFNIPATDAGPIVNNYGPYLLVVNIDCGSIIGTPTFTYDGGTIPLFGTATYDPTKIYGPNDIVPN
jgi:hypothetical protein